MAESETPKGSSKEEPNLETCGVACATAGCKKSCCKENTINHQLYGTHACSDHK